MLPLPEPGRVTAADRAAFTDSARRAIEREMEARAYDDSVRVGIRQMFEPVLRDATFPDTRQRFDQLVLDEKEATVWIQLPGTGASYTRTWFICSLTDMSFCRTQVIPHQGAVVAVAIHGGSVYAVEQLRDGGVRVARYGSN